MSNREPAVIVIEGTIPNGTQLRQIAEFVTVAESNNFETIVTCLEVPRCGVFLADGTDVPALAVAKDEATDAWTVLHLDGRTVQYLADEIL